MTIASPITFLGGLSRHISPFAINLRETPDENQTSVPREAKRFARTISRLRLA